MKTSLPESIERDPLPRSDGILLKNFHRLNFFFIFYSLNISSVIFEYCHIQSLTYIVCSVGRYRVGHALEISLNVSLFTM